MFMVTMHKNNVRKLAGGCALAALFVVSLLLLKGVDGAAQETAAAPDTVLQSADDLGSLLAGYGVEVDVASATVTQVTVPRKWDADFEAFNNVIKQSGFDLKSVKNKQVDKWTMLCPAKTNELVQTYAVVLLRDKKPVGVYLLEKPSGNVLPLTAIQQTQLALTAEEMEAAATFGASALPDNTPAAETAADAPALPAEDAMPTE